MYTVYTCISTHIFWKSVQYAEVEIQILCDCTLLNYLVKNFINGKMFIFDFSIF